MASLVLSALLVALAACGSSAVVWSDLRAHITATNLFGDNYLYRQLPRTLNDANNLNWISPQEESKDSISCTNPYTVLCPFHDPSICLLYDQKGFIAGADFGIVKSNAAAAYPFSSSASFTSKKRFGYECYIATVFFIDQVTLNNGGRSDLSTGTGTGLWLQSGRNNMITVPRFEPVNTTSGFVKQACVSGQGNQYFYNMSTSLTCDQSVPIVALYNSGELTGFAFQSFGTVTPKGALWYETIAAADYQKTMLAASSPTCFSTWASSYGLISIHLFFQDSPWLTCTTSC